MIDLDQFRIYRPDTFFFEADLLAILSHYQNIYFPDVQPILSIEFAASLQGPSRVWPQKDLIEADERLRNFPKLCCILVLHELIHYKLFKKHGKEQSDVGEEFLAEVRRLWDKGAYEGLL
jgi:hypothetical protein